MSYMPYKAKDDFIEAVKSNPTIFTTTQALRGTLSATSRHKRFMKMNLDGLKLAIKNIEGLNRINDSEAQEDLER